MQMASHLLLSLSVRRGITFLTVCEEVIGATSDGAMGEKSDTMKGSADAARRRFASTMISATELRPTSPPSIGTMKRVRRGKTPMSQPMGFEERSRTRASR